MNIHVLAGELNKRSRAKGHVIAQLPDLRKKYLGKRNLPNVIFNERTIFEEDQYAFHYGGRDEMQFNVGEDYVDGKLITRYCLAFSLEPSRSLTDPIRVLSPFWRRFKNLITEYPEAVSEFKLWYHTGTGDDRESVGFFDIRGLSQDWYKLYNFICVGGYIEKGLEDLDDQDIDTILTGLDKLLPVYMSCVLNRKGLFEKEVRLARICWNTNDWQKPSGKKGKSTYKNAHEFLYGYGHEEWTFDFTKVLNGYHYCLLQAVENGRESFIGKKYNVKLYCYNSDTDEYFWAGRIDNMEVISEELANTVFEEYQQNGWLEEMADQVSIEEGNSEKFLSLAPKYNFNVRFKVGDAELFRPLKPLKNFNSLINTHHYQFIKTSGIEEESIIPANSLTARNFRFKPGNPTKSTNPRNAHRQEKLIQIDAIHNQIQNGLYDLLVAQYGAPNVGYESDTGLRTKIDLVVKEGEGKTILYEIKSYPSVMISVRQALGQILEYAFWPEAIEQSIEMIIVSHIAADESLQLYMKTLRDMTGIQLFYQHYNLNTGKIGKKI